MQRTIYSEEHELFRRTVRRFLESEALPRYDSWEEAGGTPDDFWLKAGQHGLLCPQIPEPYGGPGGDYRHLCVVSEELAALGLMAPNLQVHSDIVAEYVLNHGSEAQKRAWLPRMVSGEVRGAIAMSEPNTGSDLQAVRTRALRQGAEYVLDGAKTFVTNGAAAGLYIIVAKTDPSRGSKGVSLFLVPRDAAGLERTRTLDKLGLRAQDTAELFLKGVRLPAEAALLGKEGEGFACLMSELPQERLGIAVTAVAVAQRALDLALEYTRDRRAFGERILDFQNTRFRLAEIRAELEVAWAFLDKCIATHGAGALTVPEAAMAKLWTSELQGRVVDACLQLFGGYGYMREYPIARMFVDARVTRIYGGTSEIMKEIISRTFDEAP
jgi:acyl-CoA dehydrogenase